MSDGARYCWHIHACPAHSRFRETSTRENAIECAKAIEDVRGWYWEETFPGLNPRKARKDYDAFNRQLFGECPELALIKDIADLAKHGGRLDRSDVKVKEIIGAGAGGILFVSGPPMGPSGPFRNMHESKPECTLRVVLNDGSEVPLPALLTRAMEYWRGILL
jgi:hypothetical protein